jgi:hypothetical protein
MIVEGVEFEFEYDNVTYQCKIETDSKLFGETSVWVYFSPRIRKKFLWISYNSYSWTSRWFVGHIGNPFKEFNNRIPYKLYDYDSENNIYWFDDDLIKTALLRGIPYRLKAFQTEQEHNARVSNYKHTTKI